VKPEAPDSPPAIPDYELLRLVGRGSYGDVWLARSLTGLFRAVKIVWRNRFKEEEPYEREFDGLREFAAVSLIEPHQLAVLHVGQNHSAGFFYYVMELADDVETGRDVDAAHYVPHTLKETRERRGRLPTAQVVTLGTDLCRALVSLHAAGLVHRDVKPSNVIFVGGLPKLADIGLVSATTTAHAFVGTDGFVPPEGPGAPEADVYGLGKLLYEIATGLDRHDYPRLPSNLSELPDRKELFELNEILIRACDPAAEHRYADAAVLLDDLLLLQAGRSMRRLRSTERRLTRAIRASAACALVAAVAATGAYVERQRASRENSLRREMEADRDALARNQVYQASLAKAQHALDLQDYVTAQQELRGSMPRPGARDLRGPEWQLLWDGVQNSLSAAISSDPPAIPPNAATGRFGPSETDH
jgi:serine/threonine protein kinase